MIYRAYVQGNSEPGHTVEIKACNKWDAIDYLEEAGYDVIEISDAPIMSLVADMVLNG